MSEWVQYVGKPEETAFAYDLHSGLIAKPISMDGLRVINSQLSRIFRATQSGGI